MKLPLGLSLGKLPGATQLLCLCILTQLSWPALASDLASADPKDGRLESNLDSISRLSSREIENAKSIDFELLSKAGDEDLSRRDDSLREILIGEESLVKEVRVEPPAEPKVAAAADELKSDLKLAELKEAETSPATGSAPISEQPSSAQSSPPPAANLTSDQLAKESAPVAEKVDADKPVADAKPADSKVDSSANNVQQATTVAASDQAAAKKEEGKTERLAEDKDPLTSASSNVDNVKNDEEKKKAEEELSIEDKAPVASDKTESKDLEATHRESDSSELNIEESSKWFKFSCLLTFGLLESFFVSVSPSYSPFGFTIHIPSFPNSSSLFGQSMICQFYRLIKKIRKFLSRVRAGQTSDGSFRDASLEFSLLLSALGVLRSGCQQWLILFRAKIINYFGESKKNLFNFSFDFSGSSS